MSEIIILSGSPSASSRSETVLHYLGDLLTEQGYSVKQLSVRDIPAEDLLGAKFDSPTVQQISKDIRGAREINVASPVYKAAYS